MPSLTGRTVAITGAARRLGADEQFIAADGTARQAQWHEPAR